MIQYIVNKGTNVNAKGEIAKIPLHLTRGNNYDKLVLTLCMIVNLLFIYLLFHRS